MSNSYIVVLPVVGSPFILNNTHYASGKKEDKKHIINVCEEYLEEKVTTFHQYESLFTFIHPMFREEKKWDYANTLLEKAISSKKITIFCAYNQEDPTYSPNMALLTFHKAFKLDGEGNVLPPSKCPIEVVKMPIFGPLFIVVPSKELLQVCKVEDLPQEDEDEDEDDEDEDDEKDE